MRRRRSIQAVNVIAAGTTTTTMMMDGQAVMEDMDTMIPEM
jgi:hypothetical protein